MAAISPPAVHALPDGFDHLLTRMADDLAVLAHEAILTVPQRERLYAHVRTARRMAAWHWPPVGN